MRQLVIGDRRIADDEPPYICAELSHNHLGSYALAREMVRLAAQAGADAVKFQKRGPSTYRGLRQAGEVEYADLREERELCLAELRSLKDYAHELGLAFLCTAFDPESADLLAAVGVDAVKVASGDVTNLPLLAHVARLGLPLLVSTGGCELADVREAYRVLTAAQASFSFLHCTSEYPVMPEHVNLRLIVTYRQEFPETVIGFSSHVKRDRGAATAAALAYVMGASILEHHFTLTPEIGTGEHDFAQTPQSLSWLRWHMALAGASIGDGEKRLLDAEATGILRLGKHLAYSRDLDMYHILEESDFAVIGGGIGEPPSRLNSLVGKMLSRGVHVGEDVQAGDATEEDLCQA